jgi:hypothetical protein
MLKSHWLMMIAIAKYHPEPSHRVVTFIKAVSVRGS